jgi:hypothetical protein
MFRMGSRVKRTRQVLRGPLVLRALQARRRRPNPEHRAGSEPSSSTCARSGGEVESARQVYEPRRAANGQRRLDGLQIVKGRR